MDSTPSLWPDLNESKSPQSTEPLLKWPGGKRLLLKHLLDLVPSNLGRYYEVFAGGAALFFSLRPDVALLSDTNRELTNCYIQVRDHPDEVIDNLGRYKNTKDDYYSVRSNVPKDRAARAARLIYLVTLSFNGIYRENRDGDFNVPYGYKVDVNPCNPDRIYAASKALASAEIVSQDFARAVSTAKEGDFVYLDPPYTVAHSNNGFVQYNARIFSWSDQRRLAKVARRLAARGCTVVVSNADHESIVKLYEGFAKKVVTRKSTIAASGTHRRQVTECIYVAQR